MITAVSELNTATNVYIMPALINNIWKDNNVLERLVKKQKRVDGGTKLRVNLEYGTGASGGSYAKTDVLAITPSEILGAAEFDWSHYWAGNSIYIIDELQNKGKSQVIDLLVAKMKNIQNTIRLKIETDLFVATTHGVSNKIWSLRDAIDKTVTATYGGFDRSAVGATWFAGTVTSRTAALEYSFMESMYNTCTEIPKESPQLIVTTKILYEAYWKLALDMTGFLGRPEAIGANVLPFGKAEVIYNPNVVAGQMWFLNLNHIFLTPHPDDNFVFSGWEDVTASTGQRRLDGRVFWTGGLISDMPISCGLITGLTNA